MADFSDIGAALVGNGAGNELAYQKGLSLGAATQSALQQARERVRQNTAMENLTGLADQLGIPAAYVTAIQAGVNPEQIASASKNIQEVGFRSRAADPNATPEAANIALRGVASGPVERYYAVGGSVGDKFAAGLTPNPTPGGASGEAGPIQVLKAFGMLDDAGHVPEAQRRQAFDVMRSTQRTVDLGGVPATVDANPFAAMIPPAPQPGPAPAPAAAVPSGVGGLVPPAPVPAGTPAPAALPARPVSSATAVGANAAEIARAKEVGKAVGENQMAAPDRLADLDKLAGNITALLQKPGFSGVYGNIQGQPGVRTVAGLLSQDITDAQAALKNIDAQTFGIAIQKMRGLGSLSNAEGTKVTDAYTRAVDPRISEQDARAAWAEVLDGLNKARTRILTNTLLPPEGGGVAPGAAAPPGAGGAISLSDYLKSKGF
jgi:hypothetical protein